MKVRARGAALQRLVQLQRVCRQWASSRLKKRFGPPPERRHLLFCTVDHYEPGNKAAPLYVEKARVDLLLDRYPRLADHHRDAAGNVPKRTWFFPPHYHRHGSLKKLVSLCQRGYGEIELHLHHGRHRPDTAENLRHTLEQCVREYAEFGIFGSEDGQKRYAFIHGDWALGNSRRGKYCGVDNELAILRETGCYADFTFPSLTEADPLLLNAICYADGGAGTAVKGRTGPRLQQGDTARDDVVMIQGPVHPFVMDREALTNRWFRLRVLGDAITTRYRTTPERIDAWIDTGIHVAGKPDWVVVKTSTHGAVESDAVLGPEMDGIFSYLESAYNDGERFVLHYVTARELYNIVKAVEAGEACDDPEDWRNYRVQPPAYDSRPDSLDASPELMQLVRHSY